MTFRPRLEVLEDRTLFSVSPVMPISINSSGTAMGNQPSITAVNSLSANGQFEVFTSRATDLVNGVTIASNSSNVYLRNLTNGATSLVSINTAGTAGVAANDSAGAPVISADARYVSFVSNSPGLTSNDDGSQGLYVRDTTMNTTYLVVGNYNAAYVPDIPSIGESNGQLAIAYTATGNSLTAQVYAATFQISGAGIQYNTLTTKLVSADGAGNGGNSSSLAPVLSQDGSTLTFSSYATNLNVPGGYSDNAVQYQNLYLYSLTNQTLKLLSAEPSTGTNATGNESSSITLENLPGAVPSSPQTVSANSQYVVFTSGSDNLVAGAPVFIASNAYLRNLSTGTTSLVSMNDAGTDGVGYGNFARYPTITADGRYVAFTSDSPDLTSLTGQGPSAGIYVRDMVQGQTYLVSAGYAASLSGVTSIAESNGKLTIAYTLTDSNYNNQVYVSTLNLDPMGDIQASSLTAKLVSSDGAGNGGNGAAILPLVSGDGSTVAFLDNATNLQGEAGNGYNLLFSYNVATGVLTQVSLAAASNTSVSSSTISISNNGDIAYALSNGNSGTGTSLYAWNAGTRTSTGIPLVIHPDGNPNGFDYGGIYNVTISGDGSTVAFEEGDVLGNSYIFASNNWQSGTPTDSQIGPSVGATINGNTVFGAVKPSISDNGQVIAYGLVYYQSVPDQVFVYDNGITTEASAATSGGDSSGNAGPAAVSGNGSMVIFNSTANNLVSGIDNFTAGQNQVYAFNVGSGATSLVSAKAPGLFTADNSTPDESGGVQNSATLSDNGRYVAFKSTANDLLGNLPNTVNSFAEDVQQGVLTLISGFGPDASGGQTGQAVISGDGGTVAYVGLGQVYSRNWLASNPTTTLVSANSAGTGGGNAGAYDPSISDNGQVITFDSAATNLTANDPNANGYTQTFVANLGTNTTILVSGNGSGTDGGNGISNTPVVSADGGTVVFNSAATNLVANVTVPAASTMNVYGVSLEPVPTATTTTLLMGTPSSATTGQLITFTADVSSQDGGTPPAGTVSFFVDGSNTAADVAPLENGAASFSTSTLAAGSHTIVAQYNEEDSFAASTSNTFTETVTATGNVVVSGAAGANMLVVTATGHNSGYYILNGSKISFINITSFTFNGGSGQNSLELDLLAGGSFAPVGGVFFNGGPSGTGLLTVMAAGQTSQEGPGRITIGDPLTIIPASQASPSPEPPASAPSPALIRPTAPRPSPACPPMSDLCRHCIWMNWAAPAPSPNWTSGFRR